MIDVKYVRLMNHAIGFRIDRVRRGKYAAYRNYFTTSDINKDWEYLCEKGLAEREKFPVGGGNNPQLYFVTDAGIEYLSGIHEITIEEID